jgi:hypothetical protein
MPAIKRAKGENKMNIGDMVIRSAGASYEKGAKGEIIEINADSQRARIQWKTYPSGRECEATKPRTWVAFKFLAKA